MISSGTRSSRPLAATVGEALVRREGRRDDALVVLRLMRRRGAIIADDACAAESRLTTDLAAHVRVIAAVLSSATGRH